MEILMSNPNQLRKRIRSALAGDDYVELRILDTGISPGIVHKIIL
jgi:hypothetical protein